MKTVNLKVPLKNIYLCFMVVYMVVREVMPLQFLINNKIVSVAIFGTGLFLIVWDLFTDRDCLKGKAIDLLTFFLLVCILSSVIHYRYGVVSNIKCIAAMVLEYFIFFPMGIKKDGHKTLQRLLNTLIVTTFVFVFISNVMYFVSIDYTIVSEFGSGDQGFDMTWGRLWGVFGDPNVMCYLSVVTVFASVYFMFMYKKVWTYILYGINLLVQLIFIVLIVSRSGFLLLIALPVLSCIYLLLAHVRTNKKRAVSGVLISLLFSVLLYGGYMGLVEVIPHVKVKVKNSMGTQGRETIVSLYDTVYKFCGVEILNVDDNHISAPNESQQNSPSQSEGDDLNELEEIDRKDDKEDISNGRFQRWAAGVEVFKTTPIFGTSPRNAVAIAKERTPNTVMGKYGWVAHCSYLEVLINSGVLGAVMMSCTLIYITLVFLRSALEKGFDRHVYIAFLSFISIAVGAFFISDVFFVFSINALLFFYLLGYLYHCGRTESDGLLMRWFTAITGKSV